MDDSVAITRNLTIIFKPSVYSTEGSFVVFLFNVFPSVI